MFLPQLHNTQNIMLFYYFVNYLLLLLINSYIIGNIHIQNMRLLSQVI